MPGKKRKLNDYDVSELQTLELKLTHALSLIQLEIVKRKKPSDFEPVQAVLDALEEVDLPSN